MTWFARDHTDRELLPYERLFLEGLAEVLDRAQLPQVEEGETALTAEGSSCLIVLIPHRALGGVSIAIWLFVDRAEVTWAQVAKLDGCHDSLDLGITAGRFRFNSKEPDFEAVLACIRAQFTVPLTLRMYGSESALVLVADARGRVQELGWVGTPLPGRSLAHAAATSAAEVRLTDDTPPPVTEASGVDEWFGDKRGGA